MKSIEQKHIDRLLLLERILRQIEGSPLGHVDAITIGYSLGFERDYIHDLLQYLKVNGYVESHLDPCLVSLTTYGSRLAHEGERAA